MSSLLLLLYICNIIHVKAKNIVKISIAVIRLLAEQLKSAV